MDFMAVKRSRKCSGFVIYSHLKGTSFASSLIRGGSSKVITPTLRTTSPRLLEHQSTRGLLMKVDHNVHNEL